jgi:hypothetical protein
MTEAEAAEAAARVKMMAKRMLIMESMCWVERKWRCEGAVVV